MLVLLTNQTKKIWWQPEKPPNSISMLKFYEERKKKICLKVADWEAYSASLEIKQ